MKYVNEQSNTVRVVSSVGRCRQVLQIPKDFANYKRITNDY